MKTKLVLTLLIQILFFSSTAFAQIIDFTFNHWAYDFIDLMVTKGILRGASNTRPYTKEYIAELVEEIERQKNKLNNIEIEQLKMLKNEIGYEGKNSGFNFSLSDNENYLFSYLGSKAKIYFAPLFLVNNRYNTTMDSNYEDNWNFVLGGITYGYFSDYFGFYFLLSSHTENWLPENSTFCGIYDYAIDAPDITLYDRIIGYVNIGSKDLNIEIGKTTHSWGPEYSGNLFMSDNAPPFESFKISYRYSGLLFTSITGILRSNVLDTIYSYNFQNVERSKYISAHRLEISIFPRIKLGLMESVIYGDRFEFLYGVPIIPLLPAERYLGNIDNLVFGMDTDINLFKNICFYASIFIDEIHWDKVEIYAWTLGALKADLFRIDNLNMRMEYTRLTPWSYCHFSPVSTYTNKDMILGHWLGQNADLFLVQFDYRPKSEVYCILNLESLRKGGKSSIDDNMYSPPVEKFLYGKITERKRLGAAVEFEFLRNANLEVRYDYFWYKGKLDDENQVYNEQKLKVQISYNIFHLWRESLN